MANARKKSKNLDCSQLRIFWREKAKKDLRKKFADLQIDDEPIRKTC
jgi:hypothetical protein